MPDGSNAEMEAHTGQTNSRPTDNRPHWADAVIAIFTVLIFLTYITSDYFLWKQMRLTQESLRDSDSSFARTLQQMQAQTKAQESSAAGAKRAAKAMADEVSKLKAVVAETHSLASAAQTANTNAVVAERPWVGAVIQVKDFQAGKIPTYVIVFTNSGKRPARVTMTAGFAGAYLKFPKHPVYEYDTTPSKSILVPGQSTASSWKGLKLTATEFTALQTGRVHFFIYGKVEYSDIGGNRPYWTHVCSRYMPGAISFNNRFINCAEYNDAQ